VDLLEALFVMLTIALLLSTETGVGFDFRDDDDDDDFTLVDEEAVGGLGLLFFDLLPDDFLDVSWLERNDGSSS
jgi:hypothetical protein